MKKQEQETQVEAPVAPKLTAEQRKLAKRGKSTMPEPVKGMWSLCDRVTAKSNGTKINRKDMIALAVKAGIAPHTASTQYQSWFSATQRGTVRLESLPATSLPKAMRPVQVAEVAAA